MYCISTLEMAEKKIAERIDANLMNVSLEDLHDLPRRMFESRVEKIQKENYRVNLSLKNIQLHRLIVVIFVHYIMSCC